MTGNLRKRLKDCYFFKRVVYLYITNNRENNGIGFNKFAFQSFNFLSNYVTSVDMIFDGFIL